MYDYGRVCLCLHKPSVCRFRNFVWECRVINCLFANFCTYLGDQLWWAFAFLVSGHCAWCCFVVINYCCVAQLAEQIDRLIDCDRRETGITQTVYSAANCYLCFIIDITVCFANLVDRIYLKRTEAGLRVCHNLLTSTDIANYCICICLRH